MFQCSGFPPCQKAFSQKENLTAHMKLHLISPDARLECPQEGCGRTFSSHKHVQRHVKEYHAAKEHRHRCSFCGERFRLKRDLRAHTLTAHDYHELRCTHGRYLMIVEYVYAVLITIHLHFRVLENCNCGRIFLTPSRLKEHLKPRGKLTVVKTKLSDSCV